jgi:hypothetical protein
MSFIAGAGAVMSGSGAATSTEKHARFYSLDFFLLKNGTQPARIHDYLKNTMIPALQRAHAGPVLVLEAVMAPHMPQVAALIGGASFDDLWNINARVSADADFKKGLAAWEKGEEPPYETQNSLVLEAAKYSPELAPDKSPRKTPRLFELRVYHSPTWRQLSALHERFAGPEIQIFNRVGIQPVLYASTVVGPDMPNLTYLIPFDTLDAREKAWTKFQNDPEWIKVRQESIDKYGQISSRMQVSLYKAAPYSPVG